MSPATDTFVSVIIPAHEGWPVLEATLRSLRCQTRPPDEIVIVLDRLMVWGEVPGEVARHEPMLVPVSAVRWSGPAGCRNIGLEVAQGDVVLFLDSSVVASRELVAEHLAGLAEPGAIAAAGPTRFLDNGQGTGWFFRLCPFLYPFAMAAEVRDLDWSPTANLSYHRAAAPDLRLDERFPVAGACEDVGLGFQLSRRGRLVSRPQGYVEHELWHPLGLVMRKFFRWGRGEAVMTAMALAEPGLAPIHRRRFNDWHAVGLALLLAGIGALAGQTAWAWAGALLLALRLVWRSWLSLARHGLRSWRSQLAAWVQVNTYLAGVFIEALRNGDYRVLWQSVRLLPGTGSRRQAGPRH